MKESYGSFLEGFGTLMSIRQKIAGHGPPRGDRRVLGFFPAISLNVKTNE